MILVIFKIVIQFFFFKKTKDLLDFPHEFS